LKLPAEPQRVWHSAAVVPAGAAPGKPGAALSEAQSSAGPGFADEAASELADAALASAEPQPEVAEPEVVEPKQPAANSGPGSVAELAVPQAEPRVFPLPAHSEGPEQPGPEQPEPEAAKPQAAIPQAAAVVVEPEAAEELVELPAHWGRLAREPEA
jgi:hypothetical protein